MACLVGSWHLLTRVPPGEGGVSTPKWGGGGGEGNSELASFTYLLGFRGIHYLGR